MIELKDLKPIPSVSSKNKSPKPFSNFRLNYQRALQRRREHDKDQGPVYTIPEILSRRSGKKKQESFSSSNDNVGLLDNVSNVNVRWNTRWTNPEIEKKRLVYKINKNSVLTNFIKERTFTKLFLRKHKLIQLKELLKRRFPLFFFLRNNDLNWLLNSKNILSYKKIELIVYRNFKLFYVYLLTFYHRLLRKLKVKETESDKWNDAFGKLRYWYAMHKFLRFKLLKTLHFKIKNIFYLKRKDKLSWKISLSKDRWNFFWKKLNTILPKFMFTSEKVKSALSFENLKYTVKIKAVPLWHSTNIMSIKKRLFHFEKKRKIYNYHYYTLTRYRHSRVQLSRVDKSKFITYNTIRVNKFRLFYTTLGFKQFKNIFLLTNIIQKNTTAALLLLLESRLEFFLYRINFVPTIYFAKQIIQSKGVMINHRLVLNKNYQLKLFDILSITSKMFLLIFDFLRQRILFKRWLQFSKISKLLFNIPLFIEVDFTLLQAQLILKPREFEIFLPAHLELDGHNHKLSYIYNRS